MSTIDGSGVIAASGEVQLLFGGITPAHGFMIQNNSAAHLWVSDIGDATAGGSSFPVPAGKMFTTPAGYAPAGPVSAIGASDGMAFTARAW
jgi:hypothetical protein